MYNNIMHVNNNIMTGRSDLSPVDFPVKYDYYRYRFFCLSVSSGRFHASGEQKFSEFENQRWNRGVTT